MGGSCSRERANEPSPSMMQPSRKPSCINHKTWNLPPCQPPHFWEGGCTPFYNQHIIHPASKPLSNTHKIILPRRRQCPTSIASDLCPRLLPYPALDSCCCFSVNPPRMLHILLMYPTQHLSHLSLLHSTMIDDRSAHRVWLMFAHKHTYT